MQLNMIKQMERYARNDPSIISLGQGIPSAPAAQEIKNHVITALESNDSEVDRYSDPQGILALRQQIAGRLAQDGMDYTANEVIITVGAMEAINATLPALIDSQRDEVIVITPSYAPYTHAVHTAKGTVVPVVLEEKNGWQLDIEAVRAAITPKTATILICNPNNPTGNLFDKDTLQSLSHLAKEHEFPIILDEVYGNMIYDTNKLYSPCTDPEFKEHIIRVVSFSKDFHITGWRVGFLHSSQSLVRRILPVHDTLVNCAPVVSQYAAQAALDMFDVTINANRDAYQQRRRVMQHYLDDMHRWFDYSAPDGGYYIFARIKFDQNATDFCLDLATHARVIAVPGEDFGSGGEHHVRLCFGRSMEDIEIGMQRIKTYLEENMV